VRISDKKLFYFLMVLFIHACTPTEEVRVATPDRSNNPTGNMNEPPVNPSAQESITWENWYLSVPINAGNGKATSIGYLDIINDRLTTEESKYFYKNEDDSYTMCTELREYWRGNQDVTDNWSMESGIHTLETTMTVDFVEGDGRTIIAQIHGKESPGINGNPATVKIRWNSGTVQIDHYTRPANGDPWTSKYDEKVDFAKVDNELFTFKMKIEDGKLFCALVCEAKDLDIPYTEFYDYIGNGYIHENYFKTGNYFAWHDDYEKAAQVTIHKILTEHR